MYYVRIAKSSNHLGYGISLTNIRKELITQSLSLRGSFDDARNVNKGNGSGNDFFRREDFRKTIQSRIRKIYHSDVWFDGGEGIVGGQYRVFGQSIK